MFSKLTFSDSQRSQQNSGVTGTLDKYSFEVLSHQDAEGAVRVAAHILWMRSGAVIAMMERGAVL